MKKAGLLASALIMVSLLLFLMANLIEFSASCTYDDIPNIWNCAQEWAVPIMYDFDFLIFFVAYPVFILGILLLVYRLISKK